MRTPSNSRFVVAAALISMGCLLLWSESVGWAVAWISWAWLILPAPPQPIAKRLPALAVWLWFGALIVIMAAIVAGSLYLPSSVTGAIKSIIVHPAFVFPTWLALLWDVFRKWKMDTTSAPA
jgi:hypothetical protein